MITAAFASRLTRAAFGGLTAERYGQWRCRPTLATLTTINERTTYDAIADHFHADFAEIVIPSWTFVAYVPPGVPPPPQEITPHVRSSNVPAWTNAGALPVGPFGGIAVYGNVAGINELAWVTFFDDLIAILPGQELVIPDSVRFWLRGL